MLSVMASEKSTVYVVLGMSESFSSTSIFLPAAFISACSICGGDITTFSVGLSTCMYSSKYITTFFCFTFTPLSCGVVRVMVGGVSSYHPPSGCPMRAHDTAAMHTAASSHSMLPPGLPDLRGLPGLDALPASLFRYVVMILSVGMLW